MPTEVPRVVSFSDTFTPASIILNCDQINVGHFARFVGLPNGIRLEVKSQTTGNWFIQQEWTES
jgi:hypothetical protein